MSRARLFGLGAAAIMLLIAVAADATGNLTWQSKDRSFVSRMMSLRQRYQGKVHVAKLNNRPAVFINTDFGQGSYNSWTTEQKAQFNQFKRDLQKAVGANTLHAYNDGGHLHVGTGISSTSALASGYKGKNIDIYGSLNLCDYSMARPGNNRTCVLFKLPTSKLRLFNTYVQAIENDFHGTLGRVEYNGRPAPPPYISGNSNNAHNCTTWLSYFLNKKVDSSVQNRHSPYTFCKYNSKGNANTMRGIMVFNHPNAPHTGQSLSSSFFSSLQFD